MASPLARGLVRAGRPLQRPWEAACVSLPRRSPEETTAGLVTRRWAEHHRSMSLRQSRGLHDAQRAAGDTGKINSSEGLAGRMEGFKKYFDIPPPSNAGGFDVGKTVTVHGFISKRRDLSKNMAFVDLHVAGGPSFQFMSSWKEDGSPGHKLHQALRSIPAWSPVALTGKIDKFDDGIVHSRYGPGYPPERDGYQLTLDAVHILNSFPKDTIISDGALFPPKARHLQLRFDKALQDRLTFRHELTMEAKEHFRRAGFLHVETPVLFKSTPEGAREFLVPTRRPGYAYALPQSPQQYKQILMASGVRNYFQFARCFRDEDLRADRQPEFTQLDLEMSFAKGENVMDSVERLIWHLRERISTSWRVCEVNGELVPTQRLRGREEERHALQAFDEYPYIVDKSGQPIPTNQPFPRITYQEAMSRYGSDKPDLRIPCQIQLANVPPTFASMITDLEDPIVEYCIFRWDDFPDPPGSDAKLAKPEVPVGRPAPSKSQIQEFVKTTWDSLPKALRTNPDGQPAPLVVDFSKPLSGLSPLGHEAAARLLEDAAPQEGDLIVFQARPDRPFSGGSTALGTLRKHVYDAAVAAGLAPRDPTFRFCWVTEFPLFTPSDADPSDPGQGGAAGFSATHHPFTAPLTPADLDLLATAPLDARADHYDLVVNGVELGGGSRRIHVAAVQEYVFREVLRMPPEGVAHFAHLLEALRAGCPPHAGFAFGWDRLAATLSFTGSVRDVIAFPKSKKGEEPVARVPGRVGEEEWGVYHLQYKGKKVGSEV